MALSLRDILTGAIPGNPLQNIQLGNQADPQFNRFNFNIIAGLGPGPGVETGMADLFTKQGGMVNLSTGKPFPSSGLPGVGGPMPAPSQAPPAPYDLRSRTMFGPGESIMNPYGTHRQRTLFAPGESRLSPYGGLKEAMTGWKGLSWR